MSNRIGFIIASVLVGLLNALPASAASELRRPTLEVAESAPSTGGYRDMLSRSSSNAAQQQRFAERTSSAGYRDMLERFTAASAPRQHRSSAQASIVFNRCAR